MSEKKFMILPMRKFSLKLELNYLQSHTGLHSLSCRLRKCVGLNYNDKRNKEVLISVDNIDKINLVNILLGMTLVFSSVLGFLIALWWINL